MDTITARNSQLVKQRSHMNQSVRRRIRAFDERMAILANGGVKVAASERKDASDDQGRAIAKLTSLAGFRWFLSLLQYSWFSGPHNHDCRRVDSTASENSKHGRNCWIIMAGDSMQPGLAFKDSLAFSQFL